MTSFIAISWAPVRISHIPHTNFLPNAVKNTSCHSQRFSCCNISASVSSMVPRQLKYCLVIYHSELGNLRTLQEDKKFERNWYQLFFHCKAKDQNVLWKNKKNSKFTFFSKRKKNRLFAHKEREKAFTPNDREKTFPPKEREK